MSTQNCSPYIDRKIRELDTESEILRGEIETIADDAFVEGFEAATDKMQEKLREVKP